MKCLFFPLLVLGFGMQATAQQQSSTVVPAPCGFDKVLQHYKLSGEEYVKMVIEPIQQQAAARAKMGLTAKTTAPVYDIPVVFHVVYPSTKTNYNISDNVIKDQIDILNKAYRKRHSDTNKTRPVFKPLSVDAEIQFHLATKDPQGNTTTGITRKSTTASFAGGTMNNEKVKKTSQGGVDPWPTDKYLNIWVCDMIDPNNPTQIVAGYATPPLNPLPSNWPAGYQQAFQSLVDGVVLQAEIVGSNNPLNTMFANNTKGKTAVHEIGHYLGLMHIFGTNNGGCDCSAAAGDGIGDTPPQCIISQQSSLSCPPTTQNSCGAGTSGDVIDNWENYMDYAPDGCMTMFTKGQIDLMRGVLGAQRSLLNTTGIFGPSASLPVRIFPNPANTQLNIDYTGKIDHISVMDLLGREVLTLDKNAPGKQYDISSLMTGQYILVMQAQDERYVSKFTVVR